MSVLATATGMHVYTGQAKTVFPCDVGGVMTRRARDDKKSQRCGVGGVMTRRARGVVWVV